MKKLDYKNIKNVVYASITWLVCTNLVLFVFAQFGSYDTSRPPYAWMLFSLGLGVFLTIKIEKKNHVLSKENKLVADELNFEEYLENLNCANCPMKFVYEEYDHKEREAGREIHNGCLCDRIKDLKKQIA